MKKVYLAATILGLSCVVSGCAKLGSTAISYPSGSTGRLFIWDSDYSAGVGKDNEMCVQGARTATATSGNAAIDVAKELSAGGGISQTVQVINPANPQTTYASDAYFAICQIALNNQDITANHIVTMFAKASDTAIQISKSHNENANFSAPQIANFVESILREKGVDPTGLDIESELQEKMTEQPEMVEVVETGQ